MILFRGGVDALPPEFGWQVEGRILNRILIFEIDSFLVRPIRTVLMLVILDGNATLGIRYSTVEGEVKIAWSNHQFDYILCTSGKHENITSPGVGLQ